MQLTLRNLCLVTATADDLFGDASDISSDEDARGGGEKRSYAGSDAGSGDERRVVVGMWFTK